MALLLTKCAQLSTVLDKSRRCHYVIPIGVKNDNNFAGVGAGHARDQKTRGHGPLLQLFLRTLPFIFPCATLNAAPPTEYEVKVAFIHNIAKFVEWPAAIPVRGTMRLCILGQPHFTEAAVLLHGKQIGGRVWEVQPVDSRTALNECRVLFIAASESGNLHRVLEDIKGNATLTVGDTNGYAAQGVMLNFYPDQGKVRFEINVDAAQRAGLKIGSQLLKLARIVQEPGGMQ